MKVYEKNKVFLHPLFLVIIFNILAFVLLYFRKSPYDITALIIGSSLIGVVFIVYILTSRLMLGDRYIFLITAMLFSIGEVMLYRLDTELGTRQAIFFGISILIYFLSYFIFGVVRHWNKLIYVLPIMAVIIFILTMIFGTEIKGSKNWIFIKGISIQTSEIIKLVFIFFLAAYYSQREHLSKKYPKAPVTLIFMAICYMMMGLMVLQREWGTPLVLFLVFSLTIYIYESKLKVFLLNTLAAIAAVSAGILFVSHIKVRVEALINPWKDIAGKGYQIAQSLFAIGSGDFFGTGIGLGRPDFIPDVKTDFIFSAICEEMGIFGGSAVILLFMLLSYRGFKIALKCKDDFNKVMALVITLMFAFQSFVIIGGVIKVFLLTGITLPFISYGGSSMMVNSIALGVLQRVSTLSEKDGKEPVK